MAEPRWSATVGRVTGRADVVLLRAEPPRVRGRGLHPRRFVGDTDEGSGPIVEWVERGGPPSTGPPARRGFGLRLLENGQTAEAGIRGAIRFEPEGVRCTLRLPPTRVVPGVAPG
jgi:hypothetical protein